MPSSTVHQCQCSDCQGAGDPSVKQLHRHINEFLSRLNEQQRRLYVALESKKVGRGGDHLLSLITGMNVETVRQGRWEWDHSLQGLPPDRVRRPGAGRPPLEKKT
jgi:hypothetical protein